MKPWMNDTQIKIIKRFFLSLNKKSINVLEWGSGGSTVYFTDFLKKVNVDSTWLSLEYSKKWYSKISKEVRNDKNINIVLFDVGNDEIKQRNIEMNDYVLYPRKKGKKYDFILIDGRKRRRCILEAKKFLKPNGAVFLHDAQRKYYHCALKEFPDSKFLEFNLWRGRTGNVSYCKKITNKISFMYYVHFIRLMKKIFGSNKN